LSIHVYPRLIGSGIQKSLIISSHPGLSYALLDLWSRECPSHLILVYNTLIAPHYSSVSVGFNSDRFKTSCKVSSFKIASEQDLDGRCATSQYFQVIGSIHDIQSYFGIDDSFSFNMQIFLSHWGHLAIIFIWVSSIQFHIGSHGNYQLWEHNPINSIPIAHAVFDPHFTLSEMTNNVSTQWNL
jgi:hypothetical protein